MPNLNPRAFDALGQEIDARVQEVEAAAKALRPATSTYRSSTPPPAEVRRQLTDRPLSPGQPETGRFAPRVCRSHGRTRLGRWLWRHRWETTVVTGLAAVLAYTAAVAVSINHWMPPTWPVAVALAAAGVLIAAALVCVVLWARRD